MDSRYKAHFPNLQDVAQKKTSDPSDAYNCIAWAFKDSRKHWWPNLRRSYWPLRTTPTQTTMEAFEAWFAHDGWEQTATQDPEDGYEKIGLYALRGVPTHAARILDSGIWTSKLGPDIDLSHQLSELEGPSYGQIVRIYRKPLA
jgi:hypothetical protein